MECKKCKTKLNEGETFCRKCATSIYVEDVVASNQPNISKVANESKIKSLKESIKSKPIQTNSTPQRLDLTYINNKDLINRGQNDEKGAKRDLLKSLVIIFLSLTILITLVAVAVSFL